MDLLCRTLTIEDYDKIIDLWARAGLTFKPNGRDSREMMAAEMSRDYCSFFGFFQENEMLVVGIASYDGRRGWINRVAVNPDHRGIGLGGRMIEACEKFISQFGEVVTCALIEDENLPSMSCFEKSGFVCEGTIKYWTKRPRPDL